MTSDLEESMDDQRCYEWGNLFASSWAHIVREMGAKVAEDGLVQESGDHWLVWNRDGAPQIRYIFVNDPSDIDAIRRIYNDEATIAAPVSFVVVRQADPNETRGDVIFDIFRLSPQSYLWHFYRVYTPPQSGDT